MLKNKFEIELKSNINNNSIIFNSSELINIGASATIGIDDFIRLIFDYIPDDFKCLYISTKRDITSLIKSKITSKLNTIIHFKNLSFTDFIIEIIEQIVLHKNQIIFIEGIDYIFTYDKTALYYLLKQLAVKYNVCILVEVKISKKTEKRGGEKKPFISDILADSSLIDLSDKIIFSYRYDRFGFIEDEHGDSTIDRLDLLVVKNYDGNPRTISFKI